MPKEREHTLPSGLSGIIRNWSTGSLRAFTSPKILRQPGPTIEARLMRQAWVETLELGPIYSFDGRPRWMNEALAADLMDACRIARILTWGPMWYDMVDCDGCGEAEADEVDLEELDVVPLSAEGIEAYLSSEPTEFLLPGCETRVWYKPLTGAGLVHADKLAKQHGRHWDVKLASRLVKIEGINSPSKFVAFVEALDPKDSQALEDELDRLEAGIQTKNRKSTCGQCGREKTRDLVFGLDFFRPARKRTNGEYSQSSARKSERTSSDVLPCSDSTEASSTSPPTVSID